MGLPPDVVAFGRRVALWVGLDPADGESLAGEAWAAHPDAPGLWRTICRRRCIDEARHRFKDSRNNGPRRPRPDELTEEVERERCGRVDPGYTRVEDADEVDRLLARLPEREALVIREMDLHDRTTADIAADLGVDPSRVSQLHTAGLRHARQLLED